jgi:hypothetical protein
MLSFLQIKSRHPFARVQTANGVCELVETRAVTRNLTTLAALAALAALPVVALAAQGIEP